MTQDEYEEMAFSFFISTVKYMEEDTEINLENNIKNYITKENRMIEIQSDADVKLYTRILLKNTLNNDYFKFSRESHNGKLYKLTEHGKTYL